MIVSIWRNIWWLSAGKKSTSFFMFSLRQCKDIANLFFGYFGHAWLDTPKLILPISRKLLSLSAGKKSTSSPNLFAEMLQRYGKYYFGYFELACICTSKNLVAFFIAVRKPSLNEQKEAIFSHRFQNGITWGTFITILMTFYSIFCWFYGNTCILLC